MSYTPIDTIKNLLNTSLYVGLSDSATLTGGTEQSLLPVTGQGSLTVPADTFKVGDSFHLFNFSIHFLIMYNHFPIKANRSSNSSNNIYDIF